MNEKKCAACKETKPICEFYRRRDEKKDGRHNKCRACMIIYNNTPRYKPEHKPKHRPIDDIKW